MSKGTSGENDPDRGFCVTAVPQVPHQTRMVGGCTYSISADSLASYSCIPTSSDYPAHSTPFVTCVHRSRCDHRRVLPAGANKRKQCIRARTCCPSPDSRPSLSFSPYVPLSLSRLIVSHAHPRALALSPSLTLRHLLLSPPIPPSLISHNTSLPHIPPLVLPRIPLIFPNSPPRCSRKCTHACGDDGYF